MRNGRRLAGAAVIAAAMAGTTLTTATDALAAPSNCTISYPSANQVASLCATGSGYHQIQVVLTAPDPRFGGRTVAQGNWAPVGQYSITRIPPWTIVYSSTNLSDG
jgi:hypothetical protein